MATMVERQIESVRKEIEKLSKSRERHLSTLSKKIAKCEKLNCNWSKSQFFEHRDVDMTQEQWELYFDKSCEESEISDINSRLEKAEKRLNKLLGQKDVADALKAENDAITAKEDVLLQINIRNQVEKEEEYQRWLEQFKASCLEDGIIIEVANCISVAGYTKSGKWFFMEANDGFTNRSRHCYMLNVDGATVFTSGDFTTAYCYIRKH